MARRREQSVLDDLHGLLMIVPFWVGPLLAILIYCVVRFIIPQLVPQAKRISALQPIMALLAWVSALAVLITWLIAEAMKFSNRRMLDHQSGINSIRGLSWHDFEELVAEAYRRQGYFAERLGSDEPDGGVDVRLTRAGQTVLVQCKQWRREQVGVQIVREFASVVTVNRAARGIIVTSGSFTDAARDWAYRCGNIELVPGPQLAAMIREVQQATAGVVAGHR